MSKTRSLPSWPDFSAEEIKKVSQVLRSNKVNYWTGNECRNFENEFRLWSDSEYSIALSNGTVALDLALIALDLKKEDEVIVTPRSFIASVSSVVSVGANPVFADVDLKTGNITAETIEKRITKKTKAIICVHLGGLPCEMDDIMKLAKKNNLFVIEDCAQAHGAKYKGKSVGSIGHIGAWSFCQDKIMTTGGEGGMVTTNSKKLWSLMWAYKDHGKDMESVKAISKGNSFKWVHNSFGTNWRMTEMQAAIGRIQLKKMDKWNRLRQRNAHEIITALNKFSGLLNVSSLPKYSNHAFYRVYCSINPNYLKKGWTRDKIIDDINSRGVPCFSGTCPEIYNEKAFVNSNFKVKERLINAKLLGENSIAFLCHPNLRLQDLEFFKKNIEKVLNSA